MKDGVDTFTRRLHAAQLADVPDDTLHAWIALKRCEIECTDLTAELQQAAYEVLANVAIAAGNQADRTDLIWIARGAP